MLPRPTLRSAVIARSRHRRDREANQQNGYSYFAGFFSDSSFPPCFKLLLIFVSNPRFPIRVYLRQSAVKKLVWLVANCYLPDAVFASRHALTAFTNWRATSVAPSGPENGPTPLPETRTMVVF
jgi:hypothetical protein